MNKMVYEAKLDLEDFRDLKTQILILKALSLQTRMSISRWIQNKDNIDHWGIPPNCIPPIRKAIHIVCMLAPHVNDNQAYALLLDDHEFISEGSAEVFRELAPQFVD